MRSETLSIPAESTPTTAMFRSLLRTFGLLKRVMEPHFTTVGISGPQWAILRTLREVEANGEPEVRLSDLGNRLLVRPPSVTGIVRRLKDMGLIDVAVSAADQWQVIHSAEFGEEVYATPALIDGRIYLRTAGHLYCFGQ